MKRLLVIILLALTGLAAGGASALWAAGLWPGRSALGFSDVDVGGWRSDWAIGGAAADPYLRARIARHGLLALSREEAVYLTRQTDEAGRPLTERCSYRLTGGRQPAGWWSITLYDAESRLPMNNDEALSIDATKTEDANRWTALIAPRDPGDGGNWLSSRAAGQFDLTLRLYRPTAQVLSDPEGAIPAPRIERLSCRGDEA
ncbi:DUF1214 domain-containing protein [Pseudopontixanthobacter vadosimaris]|uniref:DUF1214 domain-containing protein n=1 Tax=Pseudopontixanthobacter vadosimaris TaxID=2726450 RepID=UPI0014761BDE|nr:DUF1214 domain-containing protein [Pseudopontixanthobacter vadosimaris]